MLNQLWSSICKLLSKFLLLSHPIHPWLCTHTHNHTPKIWDKLVEVTKDGNKDVDSIMVIRVGVRAVGTILMVDISVSILLKIVIDKVGNILEAMPAATTHTGIPTTPMILFPIINNKITTILPHIPTPWKPSTIYSTLFLCIQCWQWWMESPL